MSLDFIDIHHSYGRSAALAGVSLSAKPGEITSLLGPSGCGKTTLLNLAAGILPVQKGEINLEGALLAGPGRNPPPEKRPVGLVLQDGALFPHMTVADNVAFGIAKHPARDSLVVDLLAQVGLSGFEKRYPHTLSGGQQQRVALARALAPEPSVLLLDEPFANIDIILRRQLREQTRRILKGRNCVTVLVTHDPEEAMTISDHVAVMDEGRIIQAGPAEELYLNPVSLNAALLTGQGQVIRGLVSERGAETAFGVLSPETLKGGISVSGAVDLLIRPRMVDLVLAESGARVEDVRRTGQSQLVSLRAEAGETLLLTIPLESGNWHTGQYVQLSPQQHSLLVFAAT